MKPILFLAFNFLLPIPFCVAASEVENPCTAILLACEDKGYVDDQVAATGQKIWADCANPLINQNQAVRGLLIDPLRLKACRQFEHSRSHFD